MTFERITEKSSLYRHLEKMSVKEVLTHINEEDQTVPLIIAKTIPQIEKLVEVIADKMLMGGRLFYIGAGTSGRLGIVDASECPPTYGVPPGLVIGIIAGGEQAITKAVENAEDSWEQGWIDLQSHAISPQDVVIGIAASGPEFVTGSTRMKSGTAQKLVLNMISTAVMIQLGRVEDNKMVNMQLTNEKLVDRGTKMLMEKANLESYEEAKNLLLKAGSVKKALALLP